MQKPPKLLEAQNVNKNKCLKNIFQKIFKPISWKENLFKKKKFGKIGNWCKMWHFWLFCNVWNCTERDEKYVHVWMILTRLLLKKVALGHSRGACLCHYSKMIFVFFMLEKTCQVSLTSVGFFWQSSTWKLVKLSGTRWTWIFSKSNTIANRTKKSFHSG